MWALQPLPVQIVISVYLLEPHFEKGGQGEFSLAQFSSPMPSLRGTRDVRATWQPMPVKKTAFSAGLF
jgi:hypothetical protein